MRMIRSALASRCSSTAEESDTFCSSCRPQGRAGGRRPRSVGAAAQVHKPVILCHICRHTRARSALRVLPPSHRQCSSARPSRRRRSGPARRSPSPSPSTRRGWPRTRPTWRRTDAQLCIFLRHHLSGRPRAAGVGRGAAHPRSWPWSNAETRKSYLLFYTCVSPPAWRTDHGEPEELRWICPCGRIDAPRVAVPRAVQRLARGCY